MKAQRLFIPITISLTMLIFFLITMPVNVLTGLATTVRADGTQPDAIGHDRSEDEKSLELTMEHPPVLDAMMQSDQPLINGDFEPENMGFHDYTYSLVQPVFNYKQ